MIRAVVYRTVPCADISLDAHAEYRIYASPSSVQACELWEKDHADLPTVRLPMGRATSDALRKAGLLQSNLDLQGPEDLVRHLIETSSKR